MPKSFRKIILLLLIIGLNWSGISAIGETFAFFSDAENSTNNIFQAGTLGFSLAANDNFARGLNQAKQILKILVFQMMERLVLDIRFQLLVFLRDFVIT